MIKGRMIEHILATQGFEQGTRHILRELAESQMALNTSQTELASAMLKLANSVDAVASGSVTIMRQVRSLERNGKFEQDFEDDKPKS